MPTLGFLKKKRTKEHDQNSPSSPVDNSPVTPTSAAGNRSSLTSATTSTLSSTNSSNKPPETMLVNHGGPQPTSAPRSAGQDTPVGRFVYDCSKSAGSLTWINRLMVLRSLSRQVNRMDRMQRRRQAHPAMALRLPPYAPQRASIL